MKKEYKIMLAKAKKAEACSEALRELKGFDSFEDARKNCNTGPYYAYWYAMEVIKGRWPEAENVIKSDPDSAYLYAKYIIKRRWKEAENVIKSDPDCYCLYAEHFNIKDF